MKIKVILFGHPNVGKSVIFNKLTKLTAIVSNYPGTTVEIYEGTLEYCGHQIVVVDAPGAYSLIPRNEAETIARKILFDENYKIIVHVVDATSLKRHLHLTLELHELPFPVVLSVNQVDKEERLGIKINKEKLEELLGIPVVFTVATEGKGLEELLKTIITIAEKLDNKYLVRKTSTEKYLSRIEKYISPKLSSKNKIFSKAIAYFTVFNDKEYSHLRKNIPPAINLEEIANKIVTNRIKVVEDIYREAVQEGEEFFKVSLVDSLLVHPVKGLIITTSITLAIVWLTLAVIHEIAHRIPSMIYYSIYKKIVWEQLNKILPENIVKYVLIGDNPGVYSSMGLLTTGIFFVFFMILPCLIVLYFVLGVLEDSGILPRLIVPFDCPLRRLGMCGEAILPIVAGTGCSIVGVFSTRILKTKKSKFIASVVQWIGVPCMAEQVMIWFVLGSHGPAYVLLLYIILLLVTILVGFFLNTVIKGVEEPLVVELPPWRKPLLENVLAKTFLRVKEFLLRGTPLILAGILFVNILYYTGAINALAEFTSPIFSGLFNLPKDTVVAIIVGILRKDVAVGVLKSVAPQLSPLQMLTAITITTLCFPCIGTLVVSLKEVGAKQTLLMIGLMIIVTVITGGILGLVSSIKP
ncbi:MAG: ferrous iron transport protein B [Thermoprotei archaeon]|nr:MAG: ferrous iron transport protein B [Thermoprotei archaeon]